MLTLQELAVEYPIGQRVLCQANNHFVVGKVAFLMCRTRPVVVVRDADDKLSSWHPEKGYITKLGI